MVCRAIVCGGAKVVPPSPLRDASTRGPASSAAVNHATTISSRIASTLGPFTGQAGNSHRSRETGIGAVHPSAVRRTMKMSRSSFGPRSRYTTTGPLDVMAMSVSQHSQTRPSRPIETGGRLAAATSSRLVGTSVVRRAIAPPPLSPWSPWPSSDWGVIWRPSSHVKRTPSGVGSAETNPCSTGRSSSWSHPSSRQVAPSSVERESITP